MSGYGRRRRTAVGRDTQESGSAVVGDKMYLRSVATRYAAFIYGEPAALADGQHAVTLYPQRINLGMRIEGNGHGYNRLCSIIGQQSLVPFAAFVPCAALYVEGIGSRERYFYLHRDRDAMSGTG